MKVLITILILGLNNFASASSIYQGTWYSEGDSCDDSSMFYEVIDNEKTVGELGLKLARNNAIKDCMVKNIDNDPKDCVNLTSSKRKNEVTENACHSFTDGSYISFCKCVFTIKEN